MEKPSCAGPARFETSIDGVVRVISELNVQTMNKLADLGSKSLGMTNALGYNTPQQVLNALLNELKAKSQMLSLVHEVNGSFTGHASFHLNPQTEILELLYPFVASNNQRAAIDINLSFIKLAWQLTTKQQLNALKISIPAYLESLQLAATESICPIATALYPVSREQNGDTDLIISCMRICNSNSNWLEAYPPAEHTEFIKELYKSLGLRRIVLPPTNSMPSAISNYLASEIPFAPNGCSTTYSKNSLAYRLQIQPSWVSDVQSLRKQLHSLTSAAHQKGRSVVIEIQLNDPWCAAVSHLVELEGFCFSGINTDVENNDYIVFTKINRKSLEKSHILMDSAQKLRSYMYWEIP